MFGFGHVAELVVLLFIMLMFFGPKRLPAIASGLGKSITEFRKATRDNVEEQVNGAQAGPLTQSQQPAPSLHRADRSTATAAPGGRDPART